jgi:hypothetical protein
MGNRKDLTAKECNRLRAICLLAGKYKWIPGATDKEINRQVACPTSTCPCDACIEQRAFLKLVKQTCT